MYKARAWRLLLRLHRMVVIKILQLPLETTATVACSLFLLHWERFFWCALCVYFYFFESENGALWQRQSAKPRRITAASVRAQRQRPPCRIVPAIKRQNAAHVAKAATLRPIASRCKVRRGRRRLPTTLATAAAAAAAAAVPHTISYRRAPLQHHF